MKNLVESTRRSPLLSSLEDRLKTPLFSQRLTQAVAIRARYPVAPLGSLWDPHVLDRLQSPLARRRS